MQKYYLISKQTQEVKTICDGIIGYDKIIFNLKKITTTAEQDDLIKQNYRIKVINNKLEFEKPTHLKEKEAKDNLKLNIDKVKNLKELKDLLINNL